jgi:hypothetical protein
MNSKRFGRNCSWPNSKYPSICLMALLETTKTLFRIDSVLGRAFPFLFDKERNMLEMSKTVKIIYNLINYLLETVMETMRYCKDFIIISVSGR